MAKKSKYPYDNEVIREVYTDTQKRIKDKAKSNMFKNPKTLGEIYYNKSQKLIEQKRSLDVDYLLNKIDRETYNKKSKKLYAEKDKQVREIKALIEKEKNN